MKDSNPSSSNIGNASREHLRKQMNSSQEDFNKKLIDEIRNQAKVLTYEESVKALDQLLTELQDDNVSVENIHKIYLKGKVYLERCEILLNQVEQQVIELDPDNLINVDETHV